MASGGDNRVSKSLNGRRSYIRGTGRVGEQFRKHCLASGNQRETITWLQIEDHVTSGWRSLAGEISHVLRWQQIVWFC